MKERLTGPLFSEFFGTMFLIILGDGVVATAILNEAYQGQLQPSVLWGITVALLVYAFGAIGGAHFNPAVTVGLALFKKFSWSRVVPYILAQVSGAFFGAAILYSIIGTAIQEKTVATAKIFGAYLADGFPVANGIGMEIALTALLLFVVFAISDAYNTNGPASGFGPVVVGLTVALAVGIGGPWTMASINPARDFGPRLFVLLAGWGPEIAFKDIIVTSVAPFIGGGVGAALYQFFGARFQPAFLDRNAKGGVRG